MRPNPTLFGRLAPAIILLIPGCAPAASTRAPEPSHTLEARVDSIFARYDSTTTPGCAVAVMRDGVVLLEKAYGMANIGLGHTQKWGREERLFTAARVIGVPREKLDEIVRWPTWKGNNAPIVRHADGHETHMHVRIKCAPEEPKCKSGP